MGPSSLGERTAMANWEECGRRRKGTVHRKEQSRDLWEFSTENRWWVLGACMKSVLLFLREVRSFFGEAHGSPLERQQKNGA
jgi:hypothetical protein